MFEIVVICEHGHWFDIRLQQYKHDQKYIEKESRKGTYQYFYKKI